MPPYLPEALPTHTYTYTHAKCPCLDPAADPDTQIRMRTQTSMQMHTQTQIQTQTQTQIQTPTQTQMCTRTLAIHRTSSPAIHTRTDTEIRPQPRAVSDARQATSHVQEGPKKRPKKRRPIMSRRGAQDESKRGRRVHQSADTPTYAPALHPCVYPSIHPPIHRFTISPFLSCDVHNHSPAQKSSANVIPYPLFA